MQSKSRRDIQGSDFDQGHPIVFDLGSPIYGVFDAVGNFSFTYNWTGTSVQILPTVIRKDNFLTFHLLINGPPKLTHHNPLPNVIMRDKTTYEKVDTLASDLVGSIVVAVVIIAGGFWAFHPFQDIQKYSVAVGVVSVFAAASIIAVFVNIIKYMKRHLLVPYGEAGIYSHYG
jgi:hypothetical protein